MAKNIETVQDLIDILNTIDDKSQPLNITGICGYDNNSRNIYHYFYTARIWDKSITRKDHLTLVLE